MIQYPTRTKVIERLAKKRCPQWHGKAQQRTAVHQTARQYIKKGVLLPNGKKATEFWGEVKGVFLTVQYGKCAYCEAKLGERQRQWALEHFRPKDRVLAWKYKFPTGPAMPSGYYLLSYDLSNYAAACTVCNSSYKRSYFPIAHSRVAHGQTVAAHVLEGAYLLYPLGDQAEDPKQYIEFQGVQAVAKGDYVRGQLLIDFFALNRESLQRMRAEWLVHTFRNAFEGFLAGKPPATKTMQWLLSHKAPFTNCTQCFLRLCLTKPAEADRQYRIMEGILRKLQ